MIGAPSKNSSIELIRLIAVVLITFTHTRNELTESDGLLYFFVRTLPTYGTTILSVVSGYLYFKISRKRPDLFKRKIKSLAVPYLIANVSVVLLVVVANYLFGYNALNRLTYDFRLISEGILALNSPPVNPPTYFIRDIFVIFSILALLTQRQFWALLVLVPLALFGTVLIRYDIAILFVIGILYAKYARNLSKTALLIALAAINVLFFYLLPDYLKYSAAVLLFAAIKDLNFDFYGTGRFSYLLHLYHSPIMVVSYPILMIFITDPLLRIVAQILVALLSVYILFLVSKVYRPILILSGGR